MFLLSILSEECVKKKKIVKEVNKLKALKTYFLQDSKVDFLLYPQLSTFSYNNLYK